MSDEAESAPKKAAKARQTYDEWRESDEGLAVCGPLPDVSDYLRGLMAT